MQVPAEHHSTRVISICDIVISGPFGMCNHDYSASIPASSSGSTRRMRLVAYITLVSIHYQQLLFYSSIITIITGYHYYVAALPLYDISIALSVLSGLTLLWLCNCYYNSKPNVFCIDHVEFDAPPSWKVSHEDIINIAKIQGCYTEDSLNFMQRLLERSGTCPDKSAAYPPVVVESLRTNAPADASAVNTREEAREVIITTVKDLLKKTGVHPKSIDYIIVNCAMYNPTPSHAAMIVNEVGMRNDVITYNLSGMGCSAGVITIDLATRLLRETRGRALIVSTEILTRCFYRGNDREPLMGNTLFRCGGAAALLSSLPKDLSRAKYKLLHTVRTQVLGNESFETIMETDDSTKPNSIVTLRLQKSIIKVAAVAIKQNFTKLAYMVLPLRELLKVLYSMVTMKMRRKSSKEGRELYVPDFRKGTDHWCIHAGGRGVLDTLQDSLQLSDYDIQASRSVLYERGNTSSSSIWYELAWLERDQRIKRGDRVLQLAFGSGFKCNSSVWLAMHNIDA
ncbi:conserved hypothetical protein [Perkinsus marinus ATCC 50983]|uniref:3-ketoacyl-CoA synthase n=1 Tax=Perkinsus marinus (strain ATCC 50983 / TXsc) TaxID=423536 RepID=C5LZ24_PERM5|nr:conserved hypothetical protein [Perkinsus marinus ATCC 50983]EEQ98033.1 conserved hypothetical protein [Perkinsus marinus ATCC 50983]|eukprot:XP_002765316.1 conserved hypothetical protein [Perkinsus marinus ATCC 50983]